MIALLLWLLATLDAAFIGYREAAGRSALINKRAYYRRAMLRGAAFGQIAVFCTGLLIFTMLSLSPQPDVLIDDFNAVGRRLLVVFLPFALIIFFAFALRLIPSVDLKSMTSTVIFGPFTLLRPLVTVAGMVYGFLAAPKWQIFTLGVFVLSMMLGLEWVIGRLRAKLII